VTRRLWIVTHADVAIDPEVPVPDLGLSPRGAAWHAALARTWVARRPPPTAIWSSAERKARKGAAALAEAFGRPVRIDEALGENDRSATGYIPEPEFSPVAAEFFARPEGNVRGWERAVDAQIRIVAAVERVVASTPGEGDIAIFTHGGVSALLLCARLGRPITDEAGPGIAGGGGICAVEGPRVARGWRPIEGEDALDDAVTTA
jgi:broad specificity phosphatase PhoE